MGKVHEFPERLEFSLDESTSEYLDDFYKSYFPHATEIELVQDIEMQKKGIDKIIYLKCGKKVLIDEKIREKDYGDILLEEYSVKEQKKWGWLGRGKYTDFISYVIKPTKKVYMIPFLLLQNTWLRKYKDWEFRAYTSTEFKYEMKEAKNKNYTTTNFPIPWKELKEELIISMSNNWIYVESTNKS